MTARAIIAAMRTGPLALSLAFAVALAGCGGDGGGLGTTGGTTTATLQRTTPPTATAPGAAPPPTDVPPETVAPTTSGTEPGPAESAPRIPADFAIGRRALRPPVIGVTARVPVQLTLRSEDGRAHSATLEVRPAVRLRVPAHGRVSVLVPPPGRGTWRLSVDGGRLRGSLVVGERAPGP